MATASGLQVLQARSKGVYACPDQASTLAMHVDCPRKTSRSKAVASFTKSSILFFFSLLLVFIFYEMLSKNDSECSSAIFSMAPFHANFRNSVFILLPFHLQLNIYPETKHPNRTKIFE